MEMTRGAKLTASPVVTIRQSVGGDSGSTTDARR
jgi:hypothetical protein